MMNRFATATLAVFLAAAPAAAEKTRVWRQTKASEFEKGTAENVSIRSDGSIEPALRRREVFSAPSEYLWDLARGADGAVYAAGGPDAKVYRISPAGESSVFFETEAVETHALALDAKGNLYVATAPEAKVFRVAPDRESAVFYDPHAAYIWDMAFDSNGDLYLATGDKGEIHRVSPDGTGEVYFQTEETHVRSLAFAPNGDLIVGVDPSGLVMRISKEAGGEAKGFVLYQSPKKEVTAIAVAADGTIYAAGVGTRTAAPPTSRPTPTPRVTTAAPHPTTRGGPAVQVTQSNRPAVTASQPRPTSTRVRGGSAVVRIAPDGEPRQVWASATDIVYSLGLDSDERLLIGTGDRGRLIRLESDTASTLLLTSTSSQITAIQAGGDGAMLVATSNVGTVFQLGPELGSAGRFESDVLDAKGFAQWGRLEWEGEGEVTVSIRSGNLLRPVRNWSDWGREAPPARFAQWRAELRSAESSDPPRVEAVTLYYRPKNLAPRIEEIEVTPANYRFAPKRTSAASKNLTLPALGRKPVVRRGPSSSSGQQTLNPSAGSQGVRWRATDPNQDKLRAKIEIRGEGESQWKLLEDEIEEAYRDFDSTAFADGRYRLRISVSDAADNPAGEGLEDVRESEPFLIDNSAPMIEGLGVEPENGRLRIRFRAVDATSKIERAEVSVNGGEWKGVTPTSGIYDATALSFDFLSEEVEGDEHVVAVRAEDERENRAVAKVTVGR